MEIVYIDSSSDSKEVEETEEGNDDIFLHLLFNIQIFKMDNNNDIIDEEEEGNFDILPVLLMSLFIWNTKWEHQGLAWLVHVKKLQYKKAFTQHIKCCLNPFNYLSICCVEIFPTTVQSTTLHPVRIPQKQHPLL